MSLEKVSVLIIVTAQQQPQPQQYNKTTITVVGLRQKNRWEPPPTRNSKLHDREEIEQN